MFSPGTDVVARGDASAAQADATAALADAAAAQGDANDALAWLGYGQVGPTPKRTLGLVLTDYANVKAYGAIGDGASHPLSAYYADLAAAQAIYPHATALTNELDWAAIQAAINAFPAPGGPVYAPRGKYLLGNAAPGSPKSLLLQLCTQLLGSGVGRIAGGGEITTIDATQLLTAAAIIGAPNAGNVALRNFLLSGPDGRWYPATIGIDAGAFASNVEIRNVTVEQFYRGFFLNYAQNCLLDNCTVNGQGNACLDIFAAKYITVVGGNYANCAGMGANPANIRIDGDGTAAGGAESVRLLLHVQDEAFKNDPPNVPSCLLVRQANRVYLHGRHMFYPGAGYGIRLGDGVGIQPTNCVIEGVEIDRFAPGTANPVQTIDIHGSGHVLINVRTDAHGGGDIADAAGDTRYLNVNGLYNFGGGAPVGKQNAATPTVAEIKAGLVALGLFNP